MFQGCARPSPENFERGSRGTVASRNGGCEDSPGVPWGLELVERRAGGGIEDDAVENVVVGREGEIHGRWVDKM